jgi:hypothetical protein
MVIAKRFLLKQSVGSTRKLDHFASCLALLSKAGARDDIAIFETALNNND